MEERIIRTPAERHLGYLRVLEARAGGTSLDRLRTLSADPILPVRVFTARNPNTPPDVLATLLQDEHSTVRWNALLHPRTPAAALEIMARRKAWEAEASGRLGMDIDREYIAHHPNTPPGLRAELLAAGACRHCPDPSCTTFQIYLRRS